MIKTANIKDRVWTQRSTSLNHIASQQPTSISLGLTLWPSSELLFLFYGRVPELLYSEFFLCTGCLPISAARPYLCYFPDFTKLTTTPSLNLLPTSSLRILQHNLFIYFNNTYTRNMNLFVYTPYFHRNKLLLYY